MSTILYFKTLCNIFNKTDLRIYNPNIETRVQVYPQMVSEMQKINIF